jgi:energy-coupling factor transporter ATP-binding protein EcfA2
MSRMPAVRPLSQILPSGSEGGMEFARIVNLLLFYEARRTNTIFHLYSDRAGDAYGLDAFDSQQNGYQYKFYPSPLSTDHRSNIIDALESAIAQHDESGISKWILVTPDDLTNSGTRRRGGDVEWFAGLKDKFAPPFELEHFGHMKLQGLFFNFEPLCLHYYPEIIPDGLTRRSTIQNILTKYNNNLKVHCNRIEFVGMSVRKDEASRGLPMEAIYIPLETVAEGTAADVDETKRTNPLTLLQPDRRTVILGDPGSGKSTVLRFLAVAGLIPELQQRYTAQADDRLTVLVTVRGYADELKSNNNLGLIDYIVATTRANYSIPDFSSDFLTHFLKTGRTILLFDGIDELPNVRFKTIVRDRVQSLATSFPGNTIIVTSRIAGYDTEARFSIGVPFDHCQMAALKISQQQRFVEDWHRERTDDPRERTRLVADLMSILTNPDHVAIRELARNPLLLTIMVLVHRIDVVLPDQRVKLYEKCIETLMFTWLDRKKSLASEVSQPKGVERRQWRRLAAVAQWMHEQAGSGGADKRAIVPTKQLSKMLTDHILEVEYRGAPTQQNNDDAENEAQEFLGHVRERAGLLIEVGADLYSFLHMTFQEYLAARHIIIQSEVQGDSYIWQKLGPLAADPRWREVIRLLVAERQSEESQRNLTDNLLKAGCCTKIRPTEANLAALCGGLLIDRVPAATERAADILAALLLAVAHSAEDQGVVTALLGQLTTLLGRAENAGPVWDAAVQQALERADNTIKAGIVLATFALPLPKARVTPLMAALRLEDAQAAALADGLLWGVPVERQFGEAFRDRLMPALQWSLVHSPSANIMANVVASTLPHFGAQQICQLMMTAAAYGNFRPFADCAYNQAQIHALTNKRKFPRLPERVEAQPSMLDTDGIDRELRYVRLIKNLSILDISRKLYNAQDRDNLKIRIQYLNRNHISDPFGFFDLVKSFPQYIGLRPNFPSSELLVNRSLQDAVVDFILYPLNFPRLPIWREAVRRHYLPNLPDLLNRCTLFRPETLAKTAADLRSGEQGDTIWRAACWLLLDMGLAKLSEDVRAAFDQLLALCEQSNHPVLAFLLAVRRASEGDRPDETANATIRAMLQQPAPALRDLLVTSCWIDPD